MQRAATFYAAVFGFDFTYESIHGNELAFLPYNPEQPGISGALAKGEIYKPSLAGVLIYLHTPSIEATLKHALAHGGKQLFARTAAGDYGFVGEIEDSEGNRIGLFEPITP
jgi:predicted enzyme related to lactoylglutathione lyase